MATVTLRHPTAIMKDPAKRRRLPVAARCAEVSGSTAAECAVVCCCFPFALLDLVVLAVVRLPAGLCRRAIRRRRLERRAAAMAISRRRSSGATSAIFLASPSEDNSNRLASATSAAAGTQISNPEASTAAEQLEREMWERFSNAGFGRSPSQRE